MGVLKDAEDFGDDCEDHVLSRGNPMSILVKPNMKQTT